MTGQNAAFVEMAARNNDSSETGDRRRVLLVICCLLRLFYNFDFCSKSRFFLEARQPAAFC